MIKQTPAIPIRQTNKSKSMSNAAKCLKTLWCTGALFAVAAMVPADYTVLGVQKAAAQNLIKVKQSSQGSERIKLGLNKSLVIDLPADAHDILVANPEVADAVTRTARRIYLFGKEVGETNIFVFDKDGNQVVSLELQIERDVAGLDRYLARFVEGSNIKTEIINDNIVLTGTVQTPRCPLVRSPLSAGISDGIFSRSSTFRSA